MHRTNVTLVMVTRPGSTSTFSSAGLLFTSPPAVSGRMDAASKPVAPVIGNARNARNSRCLMVPFRSGSRKVPEKRSVPRQNFRGNLSSEIGDARRVAVIAHGEGNRILQPVVPDAIRIVGSRSHRIIPRTKITAKTISHPHRIPGRHGAEMNVLEFSI